MGQKSFRALTLIVKLFGGDCHRMTIWINRLPVSAAGWQHGSPICFVTFNSWKIANVLITQESLKLEKKYAHI
jgi:hypothetical protein